MKIIHCADLHLDSKLTANLSKEQAKERRVELLQTYERMVSYASEQGIRAIIIAGDMFDTNRVSALARNTVIGTIVNHPEIDFYYLKGNHDFNNALEILDEPPENLKLFQDTWHTYVVDPETGGSVTVTGVELEQCKNDSIYDSLVLEHDKFNIVVLHGQESVYGIKDKAETVNLGALRNKGIDYLALGHIHTYKVQELDKRGVYCYPGCLDGRGFDETGVCGFVLLDIDEEKRTCKSEFIPFASRTLYVKHVDISDCMTSIQIAGRVGQELDREGYSDRSLIKVVLTGNVDIECEKNIEYLKKQLENRCYFLKIYDETRFAVDYRAFALDESLKGEFVRTVNAAADLDEETKAEIIRYGIQALAGEEIG